jgi:hypothetical protein
MAQALGQSLTDQDTSEAEAELAALEAALEPELPSVPTTKVGAGAAAASLTAVRQARLLLAGAC